MSEHIKIGLVSISDRASDGTYEDQGIPALRDWLGRALTSPWSAETRLIPDERPQIEATLRELVDEQGCSLILTTGGTGPAVRDVTPEATLAVGDKDMPGFGEEMRFLEEQARLAEKRLNDFLFNPTHTVSVGQLQGGDMLGNLVQIRETARELSRQAGSEKACLASDAESI